MRLFPCPFCGHEKIDEYILDDILTFRCGYCGAVGPTLMSVYPQSMLGIHA